MSTNGERVVRFGVIGCGRHATAVDIPNLYAVPGVEVVGICDLDEEKAKAILEEHGARYHTTDAERIFRDPDIDAVTIVAGPEAHPALCVAAARAGKHVFVEKPIALTIEETAMVVKAVEKAGVLFQYGVCNRLAPMVRLAKRMIPNPAYSYCQCARTVTHQAVHNLDLAVNLFHESPLVKVYAAGSQVWGVEADRHLPMDGYVATLSFADDSHHCYIQHGECMNGMLKKYHYQLFGRDGNCVYLAKRFKECHLMGGKGEVTNSWSFNGGDNDRGPFGYMGHYDELAELVQRIRENAASCTMTARDAALVVAVEHAITRSVETGAPVDFQAFLKDNSVPAPERAFA